QFKTMGNQAVYKLKNGQVTHSQQAWYKFIKTHSKEEVIELVNETKENWINSYKTLLDKIKVPKILLWFSTRDLDWDYQISTDYYKFSNKFFGPFPQLVNREMADEIKPLCDFYTESVSNKGFPQKLINLDGSRSKISVNKPGFNTYYPSPEMHEDASIKLNKVIKKYFVSEQTIESSFVFIHIHKCGGSSLRKIINNTFLKMCDADSIFIPTCNKIPNEKILNVKEYLNATTNEYKVYACHENYDFMVTRILKSGKTLPFICTLLRDPVERLISHYEFFTREENNISLEKLPPDRLKNYCIQLGNLMVRKMGYMSGEENSLDEMLVRAKNRLENIDLFGFVEDFDVFINKLNKINPYGLHFEDSVFINKNSNKKLYSDDFKAKIRPYCKWDIELYDHAKYLKWIF
ncbi:unnamed protein product, partial [marine sediment metagenome]